MLAADDGQGLRIGAAVTARQLERDPHVRSAFTSIAESGALVGSIQVRNLATVGGNICNAAPSADMAPPLVALDAEAVIAGPRGRRRRVPIASFFTGVRVRCSSERAAVEFVVPRRDRAAVAISPANPAAPSSTSRSSGCSQVT